MTFENLKDELLSSVDTGLKFAKTLERDAEFELYLYYEQRTRANITQGVVDAADGVVEGNAVRVAKKNSVSFASSSGVSQDRIRRSIREAVNSLRAVSIKDERFRGFCEPRKPGKEGAFTREILDLGKEELIRFAHDMVKEGQEFDKRIQTVGSECSAEWGGFAVGNTLGLQQASRSAVNGFEVYCLAVDGDERRTAYEFDVTRENLIETAKRGEKAARRAISLLGAKKLGKTTTMRTVWKPVAGAAYIRSSLAQSASGNNVVEGRSPIANKIRGPIANPQLTIVDEGQNPSGINTDAIDAEGFPQQNTPIIENGKLSHFLFDTYYARIHGFESTGNCARHNRPFGSTLPYETSPGIRPKNLKVEPGSKTLDDLLSSIDGQAILIVDTPIGIFHSDVSTGEFSAVAQSAFLVEDGRKKYPLQPISVSGSFYKGFEQLFGIGSDLEKTMFAVETPSLAFDGFSVVG
jgi:predicted Zn-dependent protease